MKKLVTFLSVVLAIACSKGDGNDENPPTTPVPDEENQIPSVPLLSYPSQNLVCVENELTFMWNESVDSDGDAVTYQIQIAEDPGFATIINDVTRSETSYSLTLVKGETYHWRVRAVDSQEGASAFSAHWKFYTQADPEVNTLPNMPVVLSPEDGAVVELETTLSWEATDADGDALVYDLFLSKDPDPALLLTDHEGTSYSATLEPGSTYYWKIVVKDSRGGIAVGPVWAFSTP